jgi:hypothetical protein
VGPAAAQVVVVHRGQIVVHQAVDVDESTAAAAASRVSSGAPSASPVVYTSTGRTRLPPASVL